MPIYRYSCASCGEFEQRAGYDDQRVPCECGAAAIRRPFSGGVGMIVEGRVLVTDPVEAQYQALKANRDSGWDYDRAIRHVRKGITETENGKFFDAVRANA